MLLYNAVVMQLIRTALVPLIAALAFLAFSGDLLADAVCCAMGHSEVSSESSAPAETDSCPHCICATHAGTLSMPGVSAAPLPDVQPDANFLLYDEHAPDRLPAAIDHPPQLG